MCWACIRARHALHQADLSRLEGTQGVHIAGSSEEYGLVLPHEIPLREESPLRPLSPYAVSKVTQDLLAYQYWRSYQLHVVRTRGFNHTGPRRGDVFVTSNFSRQVASFLRAGIPIVDALAILAEDNKNKAMVKVVEELRALLGASPRS